MIRYTDKKFPAYAFTPAKNPHPRSHPDGHSYNIQEEITELLDPKKWQDSENYLYGIDLFNHGYYWEAHEAWESVWKANGKKGLTADFLKALIKLTASGVKVLQRQEKGIKDHSLAAGKIFSSILESVNDDIFAGISLKALINFTDDIYTNAENLINNQNENTQIIFIPHLEIKTTF